MRGFLVGTAVLIGLYVAVQQQTAAAAAAGSGLLIEGLQRLLSPAVAGVPQRGGGRAGVAIGGRLAEVGKAAADAINERNKGKGAEMKTALGYTAALIAVYLIVSNATGAGRFITAGGTAYSGVVKTLQGRG